MFTHDAVARRGRSRRVLSLPVLTGSFVLAGAVLDGAFADTPEGWETPPDVSGFEYLLIFLLIPAGLAALIAFVAFLPTLAGDHGYQPGQAWRGESEWFGGPRRGVSAADDVTPEQLEASSTGTGGTSGRW